MGYVAESNCVLGGFRKLPPAHALEFDLSTGAIRIWEYWKIPCSPDQRLLIGVLRRSIDHDTENLLEDSVGNSL